MVPGMAEGLECMYNIKRLLDYCESVHSLKVGYWIFPWSVILHYTATESSGYCLQHSQLHASNDIFLGKNGQNLYSFCKTQLNSSIHFRTLTEVDKLRIN